VLNVPFIKYSRHVILKDNVFIVGILKTNIIQLGLLRSDEQEQPIVPVGV
jgi:hypothetical protein